MVIPNEIRVSFLRGKRRVNVEVVKDGIEIHYLVL
jgi:hypothetical protein